MAVVAGGLVGTGVISLSGVGGSEMEVMSIESVRLIGPIVFPGSDEDDEFDVEVWIGLGIC